MPKIRAQNDRHEVDDDPMPGPRALDTRSVVHQTRDADVRPEIGDNGGPDLSQYEWRRPTALDAPPPRTGFVQRWVRMSIRSDKDTVNWSNKFREGWRPRQPDTLPDDFRHLTGSMEAASSGLIIVGGLVLCEMPAQMMASKRRAIRDLVEKQNQSVRTETDNVSREGARIGAPPVVRDEQITVERGRRPSVALAD